MEELKRIIDDSEITKEDDALWPPPDRVGRQVSRFSIYHTDALNLYVCAQPAICKRSI